MAELIEIGEQQERVILFAASTNDSDDTEESVEELKELVKTAGAETVGTVIQNRENIHPGTYLGKGKIQELKEMVWESGATGVVCDDELSPAQLKNLEDALDTKVMDRTMIILDIFAARAKTREGKIQVELAQLRYRAVRLVGLRNSLSRLGGGIGTRGPGETKLEVDRRRIHERISQLKSELQDVERHRDVVRKQREQSGTLTAAIVGYTNAGKSTLLNKLTGAGILAEDKLFATLDPTTRALTLPGGEKVLLTDTVGFIRKLPHHLVEAFKSTLEEAAFADVIVKVADAGDAQAAEQLAVTDEVLSSLDCESIPQLVVYNKCDTANTVAFDPDILLTSAKTGYGLPALLAKLDEVLNHRVRTIEIVLPYDKLALADILRSRGSVAAEEYREDGVYYRGTVKIDDLHRFEEFLV